jgi:3-deoxy-D-manno-octulosonic-acid transferase
MGVLYTFGIYLYFAAVNIASLFNPKAKSWVNGRKNWKQNLPNTNRKVVWFHCASLGEFDQGLPLMNKIKAADPSVYLLVTFFSPSGMEHYHKRLHQVDHAMYLPIDTKSNALHFIKHFKPSACFLIKYEFWCNLLIAADKLRMPLFSVSTLLREDHRFFKWYGSYFRKALRSVNFFFVQNKETAELLAKINIDRFSITGDTRFDRILENKEQVHSNTIIEAFLKGSKAIIIGSPWPQDEHIVIPFIQQHPDEKFILAPHDISESHVTLIETALNNTVCRYTKYDANYSGNVLLLDTIGHLASAYSYGKIAYVGGGFSGKLHNILEPAVFGLPVIFGPNFKRFPEAQLFIKEQIGFSVSTTEELENTIHSLDHHLERFEARTHKVVEENKGAADKIISFIQDHYPGSI